MPSKLRARGKPGSSRSARLNFGLYARAFDADDIPPKALQAKREVQALAQADVLNSRPVPWVSATQVAPRREPVHAVLAFDSLRRPYNFRAEQLPPRGPPQVSLRRSKFEYDSRALVPNPLLYDEQRTLAGRRVNTRMEPPAAPALAGSPEWDATATPSRKLTAERERALHQRVLQHRQRARTRPRDAPSVRERYEHSLEQQRHARRTRAERVVDEAREQAQLRRSFKPQLPRAQPRHRQVAYKHPGSLQTLAAADPDFTDELCWSCCLGSEHSRGCVAKPDRQTMRSCLPLADDL